VTHGARNKRLDFGSNPNHSGLGGGIRSNVCRSSIRCVILAVYTPHYNNFLDLTVARSWLLGAGHNKQAVREAATICSAPCKLTFDLLTMKVGPESRVTWPTSVPILIFLGLSVLELGPMYATDRQASDAHRSLMPPPYGGRGIISIRGK